MTSTRDRLGAGPAQGLRLRADGRAGARRRRRRPGARRAHGDHGTVRVGQVDAHALPGRAGQADVRDRGGRRRDGERDVGAPADRAAPHPRRVHLPGLQPRAHADGAGEHHAAARHRAQARRPRAPGPRRRDPRAGRPARATSPASCPAGSSSAWRARGRSSRGRPWCSPTSRRATSTARRRRGARVPAAQRRRPRAVGGDGHARPDVGRVRAPGAVPRRRPGGRRAARPDRRTRCWRALADIRAASWWSASRCAGCGRTSCGSACRCWRSRSASRSSPARSRCARCSARRSRTSSRRRRSATPTCAARDVVGGDERAGRGRRQSRATPCRSRWSPQLEAVDGVAAAHARTCRAASCWSAPTAPRCRARRRRASGSRTTRAAGRRTWSPAGRRRGAGEIAVESSTLRASGLAVGDATSVVIGGEVRPVTVVGEIGLGSALAGATVVFVDPATATAAFAPDGTVASISVLGGDGLSRAAAGGPARARRRGRRRARRGDHRRRDARRGHRERADAPRLHHDVPAGLRGDLAVRRRVHHRQHVLHVGAPADARVRAAAGGRGVAAAGVHLDRAAGRDRRGDRQRRSASLGGLGLVVVLRVVLGRARHAADRAGAARRVHDRGLGARRDAGQRARGGAARAARGAGARRSRRCATRSPCRSARCAGARSSAARWWSLGVGDGRRRAAGPRRRPRRGDARVRRGRGRDRGARGVADPGARHPAGARGAVRRLAAGRAAGPRQRHAQPAAHREHRRCADDRHGPRRRRRRDRRDHAGVHQRDRRPGRRPPTTSCAARPRAPMPGAGDRRTCAPCPTCARPTRSRRRRCSSTRRPFAITGIDPDAIGRSIDTEVVEGSFHDALAAGRGGGAAHDDGRRGLGARRRGSTLVGPSGSQRPDDRRRHRLARVRRAARRRPDPCSTQLVPARPAARHHGVRHRGAAAPTCAALRGELTATVKPYVVVSVMDSEEFVSQLADQVNRVLVILYALLGLSVVIAVLGIINTLALSVIERTREIGLLRAVGLGRLQLGSTITRRVGAHGGVRHGRRAGRGRRAGVDPAHRVLRRRACARSRSRGRAWRLMVVLAIVVGVLAAVWPARPRGASARARRRLHRRMTTLGT